MTNDRKTDKSSAKGSDGARGGARTGKGSLQEEIDREVAKRLAASEKERMEKAKRLAAEIQRRAVIAAGGGQNGGPPCQVGTQANETPELLRNVCGILNKGFTNLGADMKNLRSSLDTQMNSLSESMNNNFQELCAFEDDVDAWLDVDGSEAEPRPPAPFQFRLDQELSDEEEEGNISGGGGDGANLARDLGIIHVITCEPETENFFARFNRSLRVPTNVGEDLDENLAALVNHIFQHPLNTEDFVKLKEGALRPGNCNQLQVPPVPVAIWVKVSGELKGRDMATQKLHGDFLCFLFKVLRCLNKFHSLVEVCPQIQRHFLSV